MDRTYIVTKFDDYGSWRIYLFHKEKNAFNFATECLKEYCKEHHWTEEEYNDFFNDLKHQYYIDEVVSIEYYYYEDMDED